MDVVTQQKRPLIQNLYSCKQYVNIAPMYISEYTKKKRPFTLILNYSTERKRNTDNVQLILVMYLQL